MATEQQHTPGPWIVDPENPVRVVDRDGSLIADCDNFVINDDCEVQLADCPHNARLVAAAPDLLASCEEFLPIIERQLAGINLSGAALASAAFQTATARVERMRAAIAKATTNHS